MDGKKRREQHIAVTVDPEGIEVVGPYLPARLAQIVQRLRSIRKR